MNKQLILSVVMASLMVGALPVQASSTLSVWQKVVERVKNINPKKAALIGGCTLAAIAGFVLAARYFSRKSRRNKARRAMTALQIEKEALAQGRIKVTFISEPKKQESQSTRDRQLDLLGDAHASGVANAASSEQNEAHANENMAPAFPPKNA